MINLVKQAINKAKSVYEYKSIEILKYLDREINYENSLRYYTDQIKTNKLTMEYEAYDFNNQIHSLSSMPEPAIEEIIRINKKITEHTWGVILESDKVTDLNVYVAQMNKVQINARQANFFVVTDSEDLLLRLHNVFNWMNKVFYIVPNTYNSNIEEEYRASINFHCLKHLDKHISTPNSIYPKLYIHEYVKANWRQAGYSPKS
jgi:hypothetical protein